VKFLLTIRKVGHERRTGDAGRDILVGDGEQQAHHPIVEADCSEQGAGADSVRDHVQVGPPSARSA
jgi:hypothetical protein